MTNGDVVLADQHLLHEKADDALALWDVQGRGGGTQARQKSCQGLGNPEIGLPVFGLVDNGLQFAM